MKKLLLPALLAFIVLGTFSVYAESAIVTCDGAECTWPKIWAMLRTVIKTFLLLIILFATYRAGSLWLNKISNSSSPNARMELTNNLLIIFICAVLFVGLIPMTIYTLKTFNVNAKIIQTIQCLEKAGPGCQASITKPQFFTHAYAADKALLPETVPIKGGIYGFAFLAFQMVMRTLFLALIIVITYSGFMLVAARGEPAELAKAKARLWYCVYATVLLMLAQALLLALGDALVK